MRGWGEHCRAVSLGFLGEIAADVIKPSHFWRVILLELRMKESDRLNTTNPAISEAEPGATPTKHKSKGDRVFDWLVYGGLAGVGTFVATVPLAYMFKYTKTGAKYSEGLANVLHKASEKIAPNVLSKKVAEDAVMTTSLMMGGNAMLIPIGYAEKHKVQTVSGLNTILGDPTPPEQIEHETKQTWGSLIKARLTAWGAVFGALFTASSLFPKSFTMFENEFAERVCQVFKKPTEVIKEGVHVPSRTFLLGKISALDVFATAAAATLLYVAGHSFARKREARKQHSGHAAHHEVLADAPDTVDADDVSARDALHRESPAITLEGARSHEGMTQAPVVAAQLGA